VPVAPAWAPGGRRQDLPVIKTTPGVAPILILVGLVVAPVGLAVTIDGTTYDTWGAFVWAPVLLALAYPLCRWVAHRTGEPHIAGFLFGAAVLKIIVGAVTRYYMVDAVYGAGDSMRYDDAAAELTEPFRQGIFEGLGEITGTRFLEIVNGLVQAVIGQTMVGSFLVFAALGFVGLCFLYLAFHEALPDGDRTLYRRLLFLTPTLWFWPSSVGKEAFLMLCIGAAAYGFVRLVGGHAAGAPLLVLGAWGTAVVRPHMAMLLAAGAVAALPSMLGRSRGADRARRPVVATLLGAAIVLAGIPLLLGAAESFFDIEGLNLDSVQEARSDVTDRTGNDGAPDFVTPDVTNPIGMASAIVTVIARPFPWEAGGAQLLASMEMVALGGICTVALLRRRKALLRAMLQRWPRFAAVYVLGFAWGFSAVANFGILARQRSLMLPFLFVLVAMACRPSGEGVKATEVGHRAAVSGRGSAAISGADG
jgi:hypothetical protein